ncbi:hypothetical protein PRIC2_005561 [Phytophthora ramorum]
MRWVINGSLLFSFVSRKETREYTKLNPISAEILTTIMEAVTKAMENVIGVETPESFGFIIDGWSHGTEHYLAVYACYETEAV